MKIRVLSLSILFLLFSSQSYSWGKIGHRVVGEVAFKHLNKKAQKRIAEILNCHSMAEVSNWMDDIKSDDAYNHMSPWHWVSIPDGQSYEETEKNPDGDLIQTINRIIEELKSGNLSEEEEFKNLKILIHLVGDIHQPLHVGTGLDIGGNAVKVKWFGNYSNLHRVWDSEMIDGKQYSYTELTEVVDHSSKSQVKSWQNDPIEVWYKEAMSLRPQVYDLPEDERLGYEYSYKNWDTVKKQLLKGGIRLAGILNDIYG